MSIKPWLRFFRVPNLPTALGDAAAGASLAFAVLAGEDAHGPPLSGEPLHLHPGNPLARAVVAAFLASAAAELLLYLFGLADNDIAGAKSDATLAPDRPIPSGAISLLSARVARAACLFGAAAVGAAARLPALWWALAGGLALLIVLYNRLKDRLGGVSYLAMGACRGLALLTGAAAVFEAAGGRLCDDCGGAVWSMALPAALAWTVYVFAVTRLSEDEHKAAAPLPAWRYPLGFAALLPAGMAGAKLVCTAPTDTPVLIVCSLAAFCGWCAAVAPLGRPHGPAERGRAVGRAIGALLWMQTGLLLLGLHPPFVAFAIALWALRYAIRALAPGITGS
jgi:4-hydroxybenzoate polyprenyltransferase